MTENKMFPKSMRYLHDLTIILLVLVYLSISMSDIFPGWSYLRDFMLNLHYLFGTLLIFIVIPRFIISILKHKEIPPIKPALSKNNVLIMAIWHYAIYIWLIIMPISGLFVLSAKTWSIDIFNLHFLWLIWQNIDLYRTLKDFHETLSWIGIFLILWHIAPVLFHHFILNDNTLVRMYGWIKKR